MRVYLLLTLLLVTNNVSASFITQHFSVQDLNITKQGDYFDNVIQANTTLNLLFSLTTDLTARYTDSATQVDYWDSNSRYGSTTTNVGSNQISLNSESTLLDSILSIQSEADEIQEIASITESFFDTVAPGSLDMIDSLMSVQRSYNSIQDIQYKGSVENGNYSETRFILSSWVGVRSSQTVHQIDAQMPSMASPASFLEYFRQTPLQFSFGMSYVSETRYFDNHQIVYFDANMSVDGRSLASLSGSGDAYLISEHSVVAPVEVREPSLIGFFLVLLLYTFYCSTNRIKALSASTDGVKRKNMVKGLPCRTCS